MGRTIPSRELEVLAIVEACEVNDSMSIWLGGILETSHTVQP